MSGVEALALVVAVAVVMLLAVLTVLLARADRLLGEARRLLIEIAAAPAAAPAPVPTPTSAPVPLPFPEALGPVVTPGTAVAVVAPVGDPVAVATVREIAIATLGPPFIRAAALGYGVRDVLAARSAAPDRRRSGGRRPRARQTPSRSSR